MAKSNVTVIKSLDMVVTAISDTKKEIEEKKRLLNQKIEEFEKSIAAEKATIAILDSVQTDRIASLSKAAVDTISKNIHNGEASDGSFTVQFDGKPGAGVFVKITVKAPTTSTKIQGVPTGFDNLKPYLIQTNRTYELSELAKSERMAEQINQVCKATLGIEPVRTEKINQFKPSAFKTLCKLTDADPAEFEKAFEFIQRHAPKPTTIIQ